MTSLLPGPLVDVTWLAARLDDPRLVILDATALLPSPRHDGDHRSADGRAAWAARHLPGSRHADLTGDFSDHEAPYHFAVPTPGSLTAALARLGVGEGSEVVAYDNGGGIWAARLWWMLRALSVPVAVLDGGLAAWEAAGHPVASGDDTGEADGTAGEDTAPTRESSRPGAEQDAVKGVARGAGARPETQGTRPTAVGIPGDAVAGPAVTP